MTPILVAATVVAGGAGALLRYSAGLAFATPSSRLPWGVLVVNVVGSALGGALAALAAALLVDDGVRLVVLTGIAGGLTTFSTFCVETVELARRGRMGAAVLNAALNVVLGVAAAAAGFAAAAAFS